MGQVAASQSLRSCTKAKAVHLLFPSFPLLLNLGEVGVQSKEKWGLQAQPELISLTLIKTAAHAVHSQSWDVGEEPASVHGCECVN